MPHTSTPTTPSGRSMPRRAVLVLALLPALPAGGCIALTAQQSPAVAVAAAPSEAVEPAAARSPRRQQVAAAVPPAKPAPNTSAASWQMPWQIAPIATRPESVGEPTVLSWVPETGFVRGTPTALASLGRPLASAEGPNRTVGTCRDVVTSEASKVGAKEIEAVSGGVEQRDGRGHFFAPVRFRITYQRPSGLEVRESTLTCIVDRQNKIVDAYT